MIEPREQAAPPAPGSSEPANGTVPPPIRRIALDRQPTVALPPSQDAVAIANTSDRSLAAARRPARGVAGPERMRIEGLNVYYGNNHVVKNVSLPIRQGEVLALIGPSGCGKTTLLRTLNRLTELTSSARRDGMITLDGSDIDSLEVTEHRRRVSMVFQQPNPFPMSVFDNVAYALREQGAKRPKKKVLEPYVIEALQRAGLYDEVSSNLDHPALRLSGGQQQRLCIARALAARPEVLLMDEPCSALDPKSTNVIEELIVELRKDLAIVIVTHNLQQAYRVGDHVAFMYLGDLVEYGQTDALFDNPKAARTRDYIGGAFG